MNRPSENFPFVDQPRTDVPPRPSGHIPGDAAAVYGGTIPARPARDDGKLVASLPLAEPDANAPLNRAKPDLIQLLNAALQEQVEELDLFISEITKLKAALLESHRDVCGKVMIHCTLGSEASGFRKLVKNRLGAVTHPGEAAAEEQDEN